MLICFLALPPDLIEELEGGGGGLLLVPTDDALLPELEALNATGASWAVGVASRPVLRAQPSGAKAGAGCINAQRCTADRPVGYRPSLPIFASAGGWDDDTAALRQLLARHVVLTDHQKASWCLGSWCCAAKNLD